SAECISFAGNYLRSLAVLFDCSIDAAKDMCLDEKLASPVFADWLELERNFARRCTSEWSSVIASIAGRIPRQKAAEILGDWITLRARADNDLKEAWLLAIRSAATRITNMDAPLK